MVQRRLMRAQRALSREAAAVATKVVVRTTTEEAGAAGAAFSRQPFGTGLAGRARAGVVRRLLGRVHVVTSKKARFVDPFLRTNDKLKVT